MPEETSKCPWCGNDIPQVKFNEIEARIRGEEQAKLAEVEANLKREYEKQGKRQMEVAVNEAIATERKTAEVRAAEQLRRIEVERDIAVEKAASLEEKEKGLRKKIEEEAAQKLAERVAKEREILEREQALKEIKLKAEFAREQEKTKNTIDTLQRKLQKKTSNDLGDGAEIDLYEELRSLFKGDHITRVSKGQPGADIHHEVFHKGSSCGKIVYDSKNRQNWQDGYATKLRADQTAAGAVHAILSTNRFPSGSKELCVVHDVIAVSPARVGSLVQLLRNFMVRMHVLNLSLQERSGKMEELYRLISSETFAQSFRVADKLTQHILDLDVEETKAHQNVWKKRGLYTKQLRNLLTEIQTDISAIVERPVGDGAEKRLAAVVDFQTSQSPLLEINN